MNSWGLPPPRVRVHLQDSGPLLGDFGVVSGVRVVPEGVELGWFSATVGLRDIPEARLHPKVPQVIPKDRRTVSRTISGSLARGMMFEPRTGSVVPEKSGSTAVVTIEALDHRVDPGVLR